MWMIPIIKAGFIYCSEYINSVTRFLSRKFQSTAKLLQVFEPKYQDYCLLDSDLPILESFTSIVSNFSYEKKGNISFTLAQHFLKYQDENFKRVKAVDI